MAAKIIFPKGSKVDVEIIGRRPNQHFWLSTSGIVTITETCSQADLKKELIQFGVQEFSTENNIFPAECVKVKKIKKTA